MYTYSPSKVEISQSPEAKLTEQVLEVVAVDITPVAFRLDVVLELGVREV